MSISNTEQNTLHCEFLKAALLSLDIPNEDPIVQIEENENGPTIVITSEPEAPQGNDRFQSPSHLKQKPVGMLSPDTRYNPLYILQSKKSNNILSVSSIPSASPNSSGSNALSPMSSKKPNYIMKDIFNTLSPSVDNGQNSRRNRNMLSPIQQYFGDTLSPRVDDHLGKTPDVNRSFGERGETIADIAIERRRSFGFESRSVNLEQEDNHNNNDDIERSYDNFNTNDNCINNTNTTSNVININDNSYSNNDITKESTVSSNMFNNTQNTSYKNSPNVNAFQGSGNNSNNNSQNSNSYCNNNFGKYNIMYNINTINNINLNSFPDTNNQNYMNMNFPQTQFNQNQNIVQHNYTNQTNNNYYLNNNPHQSFPVNNYNANYSPTPQQQYINMQVYNQGFYLSPQHQHPTPNKTSNNLMQFTQQQMQPQSQQQPKPKAPQLKKPHRIGTSLNLHKMDNNELQKQCHNLAKDQIGCRFLQKKIEEDTKYALECLYPIILDHLLETINDQFGNYLIQKFIEYLNEAQLTQLLQMISPSFRIIGLHQFGTRVIQKITEQIKQDTPDNVLYTTFTKLIKENIVSFCNDVNGCHIIQKILSLKVIDNSFAYDELETHIDKIANDKNGCCFIQKCLEKLTGHEIERLLDAINSKIDLLLLNQYGNYVIQHIMKINGKKRNKNIMKLLIDELVCYANQKYSSSIIEKYLVFDEYMVKEIALKLMNENIMREVLFDAYGNYVVQRTLSLCSQEERMKMLMVIAGLFDEFKNVTFGMKLFNKLTGLYPELVAMKDNGGGVIGNRSNNS